MAAKRGWTAPIVYVGSISAFAALAADKYLDLRRWKRVAHAIREPASGDSILFSLRARTRPPPIGCMDWAAGRVLLEWLAAEGLHCPASASTVLEIGSGVGTTAIGLALLANHAAKTSARPEAQLSVVATDVCAESLSNLFANARANGLSPTRADVFDAPPAAPLPSARLITARWDAASGAAPLPPGLAPRLTHIIGADVVYAGGADGVLMQQAQHEHPRQSGKNGDCAPRGRQSGEGGGGSPRGEAGLAATLDELLRLAPQAQVLLVLVNRFAGGAVATLAAVASVPVQSTTVDPSLTAFHHACSARGLRVEASPVPPEVVRSVQATQSILTRVAWLLADTWGGLLCYRISREVPLPKALPEGVGRGDARV
jgi:SAM-dependent methyltransferase